MRLLKMLCNICSSKLQCCSIKLYGPALWTLRASSSMPSLSSFRSCGTSSRRCWPCSPCWGWSCVPWISPSPPSAPTSSRAQNGLWCRSGRLRTSSRLLNARTHINNVRIALINLKNENPKAYLLVMMGAFGCDFQELFFLADVEWKRKPRQVNTAPAIADSLIDVKLKSTVHRRTFRTA